MEFPHAALYSPSDLHSRSASRSSSNSPATSPRTKKLSVPYLQCCSQDGLEYCVESREKYQYNTLPTMKKCQKRYISADTLCNTPQEGFLRVSVNKKAQRKLSKKTKDVDHPLHYPKSPEALVGFLKSGYDPDCLHLDGYYPIHAYISKRKKKYMEYLYILLSQSDVNVNLPTSSGVPALHLAVQEGSLHVVKLLLIFGAEVNSLDSGFLTPLDIAVDCNSEKAIALLQTLGGVQGESVKMRHFNAARIPRLNTIHDTAKIKAQMARLRAESKRNGYHEPDDSAPVLNGHNTGGTCEGGPYYIHDDAGTGTNGNGNLDVGRGDVEGLDTEESQRERLFSNQSLSHVTLKDMEDGNTLSTLCERLQQCINMTFELSGSFSANTDEAIAITMQQKELLKYKKTEEERKPYSFNVNEGSRILFLDGGGMRGLIQIEILEHLERETGRKVTELFDWIVGTSTGGIVALALVYANKSLAELRQLYFKMKDRVFGSDRFGFAYNTEALENLLKEEFGTSMRLGSVTTPKVIVTAVYKKTTMPELHFFNNCFHDEFSTQLVWKVARYTTAAPMFFTEFEDYVDGGVLANNPCSYGFSAIKNFHRQLREKLDIALVVSVGSGIFPVENLGKTDAHQFLYFGKHWLKAGSSIKARAKSLVSLLTTALVESESVARSFSSRMQEQGIPFYRFNPQLDEVIPSGETDLTKLINMLIKTKVYMMNKQELGMSMLRELVQLLHLVAEVNRKKIKAIKLHLA